ncbi:hypothetical protein FE257_006295 [Aspergillus nanangensis]|uniref:Uncharacterized protein n=1 Tax=Aspergillus nanangensis TaxID=2582783 RepID=A0AAD4CP52_ASPNN|nr:hypothetical protein FE257_006295 [Aspergillus nanangensis]
MGMELLGIGVANGQTLRNKGNYSRSNPANVSVVLDLVDVLMTSDATSRRRCPFLMMRISDRLELPWEQMIGSSIQDKSQIWASHQTTTGQTSPSPEHGYASLIVLGYGNMLNNDRKGDVPPFILVHWQTIVKIMGWLIVEIPNKCH